MHRVQEVVSLLDYLHLHRYIKIDVQSVSSGVRAPEIDGIKLATKIREISDIPIILYTGSGCDKVASAAFEVGVDDYIRKEYGTSNYLVLRARKGSHEYLNDSKTRQITKELRARKKMPIIVLTTNRDTDIDRAYDLGCNSYICKPVNFENFIKAVIEIQQYWLFLCKIP